MIHAEPSFELYAILLDLGCWLRAHIVLSGTVETVQAGKQNISSSTRLGVARPQG